jgi:aurora kinase
VSIADLVSPQDEGDRVVLVQEHAAQGDLYGVLQRLGGRMPPEQVGDGVGVVG